jgi:hypothetical protein
MEWAAVDNGGDGSKPLRFRLHKEVCMGAPSPELVDLWLARAFNAQDIEAAAAMYHPDARVVRLHHVHGSSTVAQGAEEIRETMAGYVGLKPHMDAERGSAPRWSIALRTGRATWHVTRCGSNS